VPRWFASDSPQAERSATRLGKGKPGTDYVLIARASTVDRPYDALIADLEAALRRVNQRAQGSGPGAAEKD
jgi:RNase P protein component